MHNYGMITAQALARRLQVAEMESEIQEFDKLTHHGTPSSAPGAAWKQSMEEELNAHLSKT